MMHISVIISGGRIEDDFATHFLEKIRVEYGEGHVHIIAADHGLEFCTRAGFHPDCIVGDFDSAAADALDPYLEDPDVEIRRFQPEKDWTDTEIAAELALEKGWKKIFILGGTGTRLDHVLGNCQILSLLESKGAEGILVDANNRITLHKGNFRIRKADAFGTYVSFFAWGGPVPELTLRGFCYDTEKLYLDEVGSRTVSNEIKAEEAEIICPEGHLLMIESRD